ncbi:MAG: amidohydrolase family protein [Saprospiraceae bacterium]|nr:amidohydrolase family protein [Saprospiraceae bacterium]
MKKYTAITAILLFFGLSATAQVEKGSMLIKNATVLTVTDGTKSNTDILVENGKIKRIGSDLKARNAETIDATGMYVMPGIIDAHSHIAIDAVNEATNPVTAEVWVGDALNPMDIGIYRALAGGVTISHAMHGSANAVGGQCETIKHRWGTYDAEEIRMQGAPRTIKFALGENPMRVHGEGGGIKPRTRMGIEQVFRDAFNDALEYKKAWATYKSNPNSTPPEYSLRMETLGDIIDGEIIVHCHSYRADEIYMLLNVLEDFGVKRICFQHVNEGFKVAPELAEYGAMASVFSDWWAYKFEVYYSTAYNAAILTKNGVVTSINSDSGELIRHLYHEAAKTQRYGNLSDDEALSLITINPAKQLGIEDRVGSIEVGKEADLVIFKNHPLSIYAIPQKTIIDGVVYFDIDADADDMRVDISLDPEEKFDATFDYYEEGEDDRCMEGVFEFLFGTQE